MPCVLPWQKSLAKHRPKKKEKKGRQLTCFKNGCVIGRFPGLCFGGFLNVSRRNSQAYRTSKVLAETEFHRGVIGEIQELDAGAMLA